MQGEDWVRVVRDQGGSVRTSTALSKPSCSFCAIPYLCVERASVRLEPIATTRGRLGLILGNSQHNLVVHSRLDVALGAEVLGAIVLRKGKAVASEQAGCATVQIRACGLIVELDIEVVVGRRQVPAHPVDHGKSQRKSALILRVLV